MRHAATQIRGAALLLAFMITTDLVGGASIPNYTWKQLPPLPDPVGVAGAFAGVIDGKLIVAGGANFPDKMPWEGGAKQWHRDAYVLESPGGGWRTGFTLPRPAAYGISVTTPKGLVCIGGSDAESHLRQVFRLRLEGAALRATELAPLPLGIANGCGALVGRHVYVAGGTDSPDATNALRRFLRLDLSQPHAHWEELTPWPGRPRMLSVAAVLQGTFYIIGGADLQLEGKGQPQRTYLKDGYRFRPGEGWERIADLPNPIVAAPSPAPVVSAHEFLIVGGDDGSLASFEPRSQHPGFPQRVWRYHARRNAWLAAGSNAPARATLPAVEWRGRQVLVSGEVRPGVRSPEIWALSSR